MKRLTLTAATALALLALSACGARKDLRPADGAKLPPAPYGVATPPAAGQLLKSPPEGRPDTGDGVLKESKERDSDPYDLPPTN